MAAVVLCFLFTAMAFALFSYEFATNAPYIRLVLEVTLIVLLGCITAVSIQDARGKSQLF